MKVYLGGLNFNATEDDIQQLLSEHCSNMSIQLVKDHHSGRSKGFCFIEIPSNAEADKVIKALNGTQFQGRAIKVNQAQEKSRNTHASRQRRY